MTNAIIYITCTVKTPSIPLPQAPIRLHELICNFWVSCIMSRYIYIFVLWWLVALHGQNNLLSVIHFILMGKSQAM